MPVSAQPCGSRAGFFVARLFTAVLGRSRALGTAPYDLVEDRVHRTPNIEPRTSNLEHRTSNHCVESLRYQLENMLNRRRNYEIS